MRRAQDTVEDYFANLDLKSVALLLDVDGTLIDIGPTPGGVHVSDGLRALLAALAGRTDGALALVSGRIVSELDRLFAPLQLPAVGAHGAELRVRGGAPRSVVEPLPENLRKRLAGVAAPGSGIIVEDKGYSLALHFRADPRQESGLREIADMVVAAFPGESIEVLSGKAMIEIKRAQVSKGCGVRELMTHSPFAGRRPVFVGDDVTDESVFAVLPSLGGVGFSVGRHFQGAAGEFESPVQVRHALKRLAAGKDERGP